MPEITDSQPSAPAEAAALTAPVQPNLHADLLLTSDNPENVPLEADDGETTDDGSTIDERISNYTKSLSSSVVDYPIEYGRRYHAFRPGSYILPNDDVEQERLDMAHAMMVKAIGTKLFLAPLEKDKIHQILDIGTGTGIWAVEMGDVFESAEVTGVDLSAIQPSWVPANVKFEVDDVESPWVQGKKYDYIFCRFMAAAIADWPKLVKNIYDNLNPGGWAEFQEPSAEIYSDDGSYSEKHSTWHWNRAFLETMKNIGRDPCPGPKLECWVRENGGFENVFHQKFKNPLGPWPKDPHYKDLGIINLAQMLEGLEGFTLRVFCGILGRTKEEVLVEAAKVRQEMKSSAYHGVYDVHVVYGQKPLTAESPQPVQ